MAFKIIYFVYYVFSSYHFIYQKIKKDKPIEMIADELEEDIDTIKKIYDVAKDFAPEYNLDAIYEELNK